MRKGVGLHCWWALSAAASITVAATVACRQPPLGQGDEETELRAIEDELEARGVARDRRRLATDIRLIRGLEAGFESEDLLGVAQQLSPRTKPAPIVSQRPEATEFGVTSSSISVMGASLNCQISVDAFQGATMRWHTLCGVGHSPSMPREYAKELVRLRETVGGLEARGDRPEVVTRAKSFREEALGPQPKVEVPESLTAEYAVLTSMSSPTFFGDRAGIAHSETEGHAAARAIADAGRFDILRNVLRGPSSTGRVFAAVFLLERAQNQPRDDVTIAAIRRHTPLVTGCSGCVCGIPIQIEPYLVGAEQRRTRYELGLLPAEPRPIIRPGFAGSGATATAR